MVAAVVTLAIALAGALGAVIYLLRSQQSSLDAEVAAGKAHVADALALNEAERQRDEALASWAKAANERDAATEKLNAAQAALLKAKQEVTEHVVKEIKNAPSGTAALAALDELWSHVPDAADGARAGTGDGGSGQDAMSAPLVAE